MKTLKEKIVETINQIKILRKGGVLNGENSVMFEEDQLTKKELEYIADQILEVVEQNDLERLADLWGELTKMGIKKIWQEKIK